MNLKNITLLKLQKDYNYKIVIPQIQRDYAQGRKVKNKENKIKSYDFIIKLIKVLKDEDDDLNLDFIYGYTNEIPKKQNEFIPLDGQQRLTTLWLLHWYLSPKKESEKNGKKMNAVAEEVKKWLGNFTYETRKSSKRFCEKLIQEPLPVSDDVYKTIIEANWFMAAWKNDPTVVSMLNMLKTIQKESFNKELAWKNLTMENGKITFDYIDIKSDDSKFKLTDELYIKMNSRGRQLTPFENFKAFFSEILSTNEFNKEELDYGDGTKLTYQKYFAFKIDSVWTDLFWNFVIIGDNEKKIWEKMKENKQTEKNDTPIGYVFMNFFYYIAQMCYFKDYPDKMVSDFKNDFSAFNVFKNKDNVLFLFDILNFFHEISLSEPDQVNIENIDVFFESLFQKGVIDDSYRGQVRLFDDNGVNLFEKCLLEGNNFQNRNKIILFCLVSYALKYKLRKANDNLIYYTRVIRNLLQATRQRKENVYELDIRINDFGKYWKLFRQLLEKPNVYERLLDDPANKQIEFKKKALDNEKEKAGIIMDNISKNQQVINALFRLEDFEHFKGLIHILKPKENANKLTDFSKAVWEIWSDENDNLALAALIACDFNGLFIRHCNGGKWETYIYGVEYKNTILTFDDDKRSEEENKISVCIIKLINEYLLKNGTARERLERIISDKFKDLKERDWRFYFLKHYDKMLKNGSYFAWGSDFIVESLWSNSNNPLVAYHINPYITAVMLLLDKEIYDENKCWVLNSNVSKLILKNRIKLTCENDGWHIKMPEGQDIPEELMKKYNIGSQYILCDTNEDGTYNEKDRIEIAVDFCKDISAPS
jgi:major membrane immunogen (membrane-anchored lipoprotein)